MIRQKLTKVTKIMSIIITKEQIDNVNATFFKYESLVLAIPSFNKSSFLFDYEKNLTI